MSLSDLTARIEAARNSLQTARDMMSEARGMLGAGQERGLLSRVMGTILDDVAEPILTTAAGTILGFQTAGPIGAIMGGINGAFAGSRDIYDWSSPEGYAAFISDSTWGLLGTSLGNGVNIYNSIFDPSSYRADLSERQNRQVFDGGFQPPLMPSSVITLGNVVSNLQGNDPQSGSDVLNHEEVHIQQNRMFGPLYLTSYAGFSAVGAVNGLVLAPFTEQPWQADVTDMAYFNNPWEIWAYKHGGHNGGGELAINS